jgi:hypothetical protein
MQTTVYVLAIPKLFCPVHYLLCLQQWKLAQIVRFVRLVYAGDGDSTQPRARSDDQMVRSTQYGGSR